jgi:hypothetical protein
MTHNNWVLYSFTAEQIFDLKFPLVWCTSIRQVFAFDHLETPVTGVQNLGEQWLALKNDFQGLL